MQSVRIDTHPGNLLNHPTHRGTHWFAVEPRSGHNRSLINRLYKFDKSFCSFLIPEPLSGAELLPNLVFLNGRDQDREEVLSMNCVSKAQAIRDEEQLWCDLRCVHRGLVDARYVARVKGQPASSRFHVTSGPLAGWDGLLGHRDTKANAFLLPAGDAAWDLLESLAAPLSRLRKASGA